MKVYDIAKKYNMETREVIQILRLYQQVGIVTGKMSNLSIEQVQLIDESMNSDGKYMEDETIKERNVRRQMEIEDIRT